MLVKVDRMSMAHGLEVRVPFLDGEMVRFCGRLPDDFKLHRARLRKHILRESLRGSIPDAILERRKSGFNIPVERWMRGPLREMLLDVGQVRRIADEHRDRRADYGHALFTVMMLGLWLANARSEWKMPAPSAAWDARIRLVTAGSR